MNDKTRDLNHFGMKPKEDKRENVNFTKKEKKKKTAQTVNRTEYTSMDCTGFLLMKKPRKGTKDLNSLL